MHSKTENFPASCMHDVVLLAKPDPLRVAYCHCLRKWRCNLI